MPSILILNTATERACALVWHGGEAIARHAPESRQSAQTILQLAMAALAESGLSRAEAVAVVAGPGSFTGTRIGVGVAQGLCAAWNVDAVPLSALALTAVAAKRQHRADVYLVGLQARAEELYFGSYQLAGDELVLRGAEQAGALEHLRMEPMDSGDLLAVGSGWPDSAAIERHFGISLACEPKPVAVADTDLLTLARACCRRGEFVPADLLRPNYVSETPQYREHSGSD